MLIGQPVPDDCVVQNLQNVPMPDSVDPCAAQLSDGSALVRYTVSRQSGGGEAEVKFTAVRAFYLGSPNDEGLEGHRLWGRGLSFYSFQEVIHSDWIAELERRNRVHARHSTKLFEGLRHFVMTFKEQTLECVARTFEVTHRQEEATS
ncbi:MAG: hypothetical protein ABIL01_35945 [Pseudomonadota bacterium]